MSGDQTSDGICDDTSYTQSSPDYEQPNMSCLFNASKDAVSQQTMEFASPVSFPVTTAGRPSAKMRIKGAARNSSSSSGNPSPPKKTRRNLMDRDDPSCIRDFKSSGHDMAQESTLVGQSGTQWKWRTGYIGGW